ncbi:MAG: hypothetical protein ACOY0T_00890 [Myxococcota bacterium]
MVGCHGLRRRFVAFVSPLLSLALVPPANATESANPTPPANATESANPTPPASATQPPTPGRRALAATAALVPGAVVHGAGHYVLGKKDTALDLLLFEGLGLGMILGGGSAIVFTGASRYVVGPAAAVTILGVGVFGTSLLADIYGSVSSDPGAARRRRSLVPRLETEIGYRRVEDVQFAHHDFLVEGLRLNQGRFGVGLLGMFSVTGNNARYRGELGYRFIDENANPDSRSSDRLELTLGFVRHLYAADRFSMTSGEVSLLGRYDLARVGDTLSGSFAEFAVGYARGAVAYDLIGQRVPNDPYDLLLARFGFGVRLRGRSARGSEALLYYDHRHDDFAAGLKVTGLGSGAPGHFGFQTKWFFNSSVGVLAEAAVGSAWVFGGSLLLRQSQPESAKERMP